MLYIFSKALSFHDITTQILAQNISIFVTLFLARERVTKESEKLEFIILHRFSNYPFLSSKKDPSLPSPCTDNSRDSTATNNTCSPQALGSPIQFLNRAFVFLVYQRQHVHCYMNGVHYSNCAITQRVQLHSLISLRSCKNKTYSDVVLSHCF